MSTPAGRGKPNSNFSATAEPRTSARSQAAMAISQSTHKMKEVRREYCSRHACARSRPVAMPSFAESACRIIAMKLLRTMTLSNV